MGPQRPPSGTDGSPVDNTWSASRVVTGLTDVADPSSLVQGNDLLAVEDPPAAREEDVEDEVEELHDMEEDMMLLKQFEWLAEIQQHIADPEAAETAAPEATEAADSEAADAEAREAREAFDKLERDLVLAGEERRRAEEDFGRENGILGGLEEERHCQEEERDRLSAEESRARVSLAQAREQREGLMRRVADLERGLEDVSLRPMAPVAKTSPRGRWLPWPIVRLWFWSGVWRTSP